MTRETGAHVLVVDDDPGILKAVQTNLGRHGYLVEAAATGQEALLSFGRRRPDIVLLDLGLPDMDGTDVIREIRARAGTPILVLSVREAEGEKVTALDLGADDYLVKPFGVDELLARIRAALRRAAGPSLGGQPVFRTGELEVDLEHRRVRVGDQEVHLTPTEYDLLRTFISHPDKVLTDRMLLQAVWGPEYGSEAHYLHVYVARLRRKIERDPQRPQYLATEPGVGYRLRTDDSA